MKRTGLYVVCLVVVTLFIFSAQASAQDYSFYNNMFSNMLSNRIWDSIYQQSSPGYADAKRKLMGQSQSSGQAASVPVTPTQMNQAVQFKSTGTRMMTQKFADGLGDKFKLDKTEMNGMLSAILDKYDSEAAARGYSSDLALALGSYIALNSRVYTGSKDQPTLPYDQNPELRDAVAKYAAQDGIFNNMTNRQRQEMYEALVMVGVFTHLLYETAQKSGDPETQKTIKNMAKQNLKSIGINP
jgi:hypothetical protein